MKKMKNRVQRRIFRPMKEEVTGGWGKLHNEKLQNFYSKHCYGDKI
jgi:hypothetical protein